VRSAKRRSLVVDASVARSAGLTEHAASKACRETMTVILEICHRFVKTDEIWAEWKKHRSRFAQKWRGAMVARKKMFVPAAKELDHSIVENVSFEGMSDTDQEAVRKDLPLLKAAFAADRVIVTRDDKLPKVLRKYPQWQKVARLIRWINPEHDSPTSIENL